MTTDARDPAPRSPTGGTLPDLAELRRLAEREAPAWPPRGVFVAGEPLSDYFAAANPAVVLALIDEIERLRSLCNTLFGQRDAATAEGGLLTTELRETRAECERMWAVFDVARRWCNRPVTVLRPGAEVLANDAGFWLKLRVAVAAAKERP